MRHVLAAAMTAAFLCSTLHAVISPAMAQPAAEVPLAPAAPAQPAVSDPGLRIDWDVKNRFRLFRSDNDFQKLVAADRGNGVLETERQLERDGDGRGWAKDIIDRLCVDAAGRLVETCDRDGTRENYLSPADHRVGVVLAGAFPPGSACNWTFSDSGAPPQVIAVPCEEEVRLRVRQGSPTTASVAVTAPDGSVRQAVTEIAVRDLLIAGLGDSIASGEGNPDVPVRLADDGFCYRRFLGGTRSDYYRPGRAGFRGNKSCSSGSSSTDAAADWKRHGARWMSAACHRSLYGYQLRAALALAVENPRIAVTFIPLACSGATIADGLLDAQPMRECPLGAATCAATVPAQITQLKQALERAKRAQANRTLDLLLLTIGANDIHFSGLVADVIIKDGAERDAFSRGGLISTPEDAAHELNVELPGQFARLRAALRPIVGGTLEKVVYVTYANPALAAHGTPCPGSRDGFDIHPIFEVDAQRVNTIARFVSDVFLPRLKALARCEAGILCQSPQGDAMTFVDGHQAAFDGHGMCARAADDPPFDVACFKADGSSFEGDLANAAQQPLTCNQRPGRFRPYAPRARWIRTANDSYFTAMTYPQGLPSVMQPADIHDALWGATSAVQGGAVHPTAEGHAAMADAALRTMRELLDLPQQPSVRSQTLPAPLDVPAGLLPQ